MPLLQILGGNLFESQSGRMVPFVSLIIEDDRISEISFGNGKVPDFTRGKILDARGKFLLPGFIDAHVHLVHVLRDFRVTADSILPLFIANGITSVRNVGDEIYSQKLLANHAEQNPLAAPRIFMGSPLIEGPHPYHPFVSTSLIDAQKVPDFVEEMCDWGVQTFKLYSSVSRTVGRAIIHEAHKRGRSVTAHLQWAYRAQEAIADGIDCLEHTESLLEFLLPEGSPRWPELHERADIGPEQLGALERQLLRIKSEINVEGKTVTNLIEAMVGNSVAITPTLVVYRNWVLLRDQPDVFNHPDLESVPRKLIDGWRTLDKKFPLAEDVRDLRVRQFEIIRELTKRLFDAGVELLVGTDTPVPYCPPGSSMHQEFELLVACGIPPAAVLSAATLSAARILGQSEHLGEISVGKTADIVILNQDPLEDIRNTRSICDVIRAGRVAELPKKL